MEKVIVSIILSLGLGVLLLFLGMFLGVFMMVENEKCSPFECGFDPVGSSRTPFSLRFFLLAVIFVVFDVEVVLLFPFVMSLGDFVSVAGYIAFFVLLIILLFGVIHEWREGSLEWGD
uniref:NADH-ubiquinone oxidoreductase chain 3 n=1 Tax=Mutela dubia TaxID=152234 RepID=A0A1X9JP75_9BIVA|nr:NADH dehydrogenase subunit 3 [Mutela dubia]AQT38514.1 NADH dehydrogenase subunit 3 [Mutela dubia]